MNEECRQPASKLTNARMVEWSKSIDEGHGEAVIRKLRVFAKRHPTHVPVVELLAKATWKSGRLRESVDLTVRLSELNPYEPGYHYLRGLALQGLGDFDQALAAFKRCSGMGESLDREAADLSASLIVACGREALAQRAELDPWLAFELRRKERVGASARQTQLPAQATAQFSTVRPS